jgi:diguanylate cyclase (GGDEF)-like protein
VGYFASLRQQVVGRRLFAVLAHVAETGAEAGRRSVTDALTGLLNRRGWNERVTAVDARTRTSGLCAAIIAIDLDGLKLVNDTLGHAEGDALIRRAADALRHAVRGQDVVARVGGDEFAVLATDCQDEHLSQLIARIEQAMALHDAPASVAGAVADPRQGLQVAWEAADRAMYARKHARRGVRRAHPGDTPGRDAPARPVPDQARPRGPRL